MPLLLCAYPFPTRTPRMAIARYKHYHRGLESGPAILMSIRTDRTKGNRGAFEAARLKILKTQTICGICGKPVDFSYKNPHPLAPTVDHIIPVSKGGHPTDISNLQLAHRCLIAITSASAAFTLSDKGDSERGTSMNATRVDSSKLSSDKALEADATGFT